MFTMSRLSISSVESLVTSNGGDEGDGSAMPSDHASTSVFSRPDRRDSRASSTAGGLDNLRASSSTPNSWYAALATEDPQAEDFMFDSEEEEEAATLAAAANAAEGRWLPAGAVRPGNIRFSDRIPTKSEVDTAGELSVYNSDGIAMPFRNLFLESIDGTSRQLIVFIRHYFCRACRAYVRALKEGLPATHRPESRSSAGGVPTQVILISPMQPSLIKAYVESQDIPYPVYSDPSCEVFKALGCTRWARPYGRRPKYMGKQNAFATASITLVDAYSSLLTSKGRGRGPIFQVGGEFLFEDGGVTWCHRMRHMRNHTDMEKLKKVLSIDEVASDAESSELEDADESADGNSCEISWPLTDSTLPSRGSTKSRPLTAATDESEGVSPNPVVRTGSVKRSPRKLKKKSSNLWIRGRSSSRAPGS